MDDYNFWADVFDTYQSMTTMGQIAWIAFPCLTIFALAALYLRYRLVLKNQHFGRKSVQWYACPSDEEPLEAHRKMKAIGQWETDR